MHSTTFIIQNCFIKIGLLKLGLLRGSQKGRYADSIYACLRFI